MLTYDTYMEEQTQIVDELKQILNTTQAERNTEILMPTPCFGETPIHEEYVSASFDFNINPNDVYTILERHCEDIDFKGEKYTLVRNKNNERIHLPIKTPCKQG